MRVALRPDTLPEIAIEVTLIPATPVEALSSPKPESTPPVPMQKARDAAPIKVKQKEQQPVKKTSHTEKPKPEEAHAEKSTEGNKSSAVIEPRFNAVILHNQPPAYPTSARRMQQEGTVLLHVMVTASGMAGEVAIQHSSGYGLLDEAAIDAVKGWHFIPARKGSEAMDYPIIVPITFKLSEEKL